MLSSRWCDRDRKDLSQQLRNGGLFEELPVEYVAVYVWPAVPH